MTDQAQLGQARGAEILQKFAGRLNGTGMCGKVASHSLRMLIANGVGAALSFVVQVALARMMGKDAFGVYVYCVAWLGIGQLIGKLEIDSAAVRFVGAYVAMERWGSLRGYLRFSRQVVLISSCTVTVVAALAVLFAGERLASKHEMLGPALLVTAAMLPVAALLLSEKAILQGLQRYLASQLPLNVIRPLLFGILLLVAVVVGSRTISPPWAVAFNLLASAAALGVTWILWLRARPEPLKRAFPEYERPVWVRTTLPLLAVAVAQLIVSQQADVIIVGTMLSASDAAGYGAAAQLTMPLALAGTSATFVAQPMIAEYYARQQHGQLQRLIGVVTWASLLLTLPIAAVLVGFGGLLLRVFGPGFDSAHPVLILLTLAHVIAGVAGGLAGFLLTMTAHERAAAWIIGSSAVFNILAAVILTPAFGAVGTASATLAATGLRALALRLVVKRSLGLKVPALSRSES